MEFMTTRKWKSYLPSYRFPPVLRLTCACLALLLVGGGIFTFLVVPGLIAYVLALNEYPVLEISIGQTLAIDNYELRFVRVESDTRCPGEILCDPPGSVILIFSTTHSKDELTVLYTEGAEASDPIALPHGYLMRVISVSPDALSMDARYTARFQIFKAASPG